MSKPVMSTETRDARLTCAKCSGRGSIPAFGHYANGVCFWCKGEGKILVRGHNALTDDMIHDSDDDLIDEDGRCLRCGRAVPDECPEPDGPECEGYILRVTADDYNPAGEVAGRPFAD